MKKLGKIETVKFGAGGYQDAMFGLTVSMVFGDQNTCTDNSLTAYVPEEGQSERHFQFAERMLQVVEIIKLAKVDDIGRLRGIPIEAEFDGNALVSWRVLTEVL